MAETSTFDPATIPALVASAVAEAMKPFSEQIAKFQTAAPPAPTATGKKGELTIDDVSRAIGDALQSHNRTQSVLQTVASYASEKLKDLPPIYQKMLPSTDDVQKLVAAEQTIRAQFLADMKALGIEPKAVGAQGVGGAAKPAAGPVDLSKMSADQLITQGLGELGVVGPGAAAAATADAK
jgi:hypothetical protein